MQLLQVKKIFSKLTVLTVLFFALFASSAFAQSSQNPQNGATGLTGTVPADPPTQPATISFPTNGASFVEVPIDVTGVCPIGLLVKLFKNEVFAGSAQCVDGSFTITIDLFSGTNELVARVYDELDQPGPDSNTVTVTYDDATGIEGVERLSITSNFAKRGANPGDTLTWPMTVTGGVGPYAISVDWGDGEESLISLDFAGEFIAEHVYDTPGTYRVIVKATDSNGTTSFLQVVAVANGAIAETNARVDENGNIITSDTDATGTLISGSSSGLRFITWPLYVMLVLIFSTFWLGRRYEMKKLKQKLAQQQRF